MQPPSPFFCFVLEVGRWGEVWGGLRLTPVNSPLCRIANCCHHILMSLLLRAGWSHMQAKLGTPRSVIGKNFQCPNMHTSLFSTKVGKAYSSHLPALTFPSHHLLLRNQEEKSPSHCTQICPCSHLVLLPLFTLFLLWLPASLIWTSGRRLEPKEQSDIATVPNPQPKQMLVQSLLTSLVIVLSLIFFI